MHGQGRQASQHVHGFAEMVYAEVASESQVLKPRNSSKLTFPWFSAKARAKASELPVATVRSTAYKGIPGVRERIRGLYQQIS
jgi:hypothetical protein